MIDHKKGGGNLWFVEDKPVLSGFPSFPPLASKCVFYQVGCWYLYCQSTHQNTLQNGHILDQNIENVNIDLKNVQNKNY